MNITIELDKPIDYYLHCGNPLFYDFADLLNRNHDFSINSLVMIEKHVLGKI